MHMTRYVSVLSPVYITIRYSTLTVRPESSSGSGNNADIQAIHHVSCNSPRYNIPCRDLCNVLVNLETPRVSGDMGFVVARASATTADLFPGRFQSFAGTQGLFLPRCGAHLGFELRTNSNPSNVPTLVYSKYSNMECGK